MAPKNRQTSSHCKKFPADMNIDQAYMYFYKNGPIFSGNPNDLSAFREQWCKVLSTRCSGILDRDKVTLLLSLGLHKRQVARAEINDKMSLEEVWRRLDAAHQVIPLKYQEHLRQVQEGDLVGLDNLYKSCVEAKKTLPACWYLSPRHMVMIQVLMPNHERILFKAVMNKKPRWSNVSIEHKCEPFFEEIERRAKENTVILKKDPPGQVKVARGAKRGGIPVGKILNQVQINPVCPLGCVGIQDHKLEDCQQFIRMSTEDRWKWVRKHKRCMNCLATDHVMKNCTEKSDCDRCTPAEKKHHFLLHVDPDCDEEQLNQGADLHYDAALPTQDVDLFPSKEKCSVMFDSGSQVTLVREEYAEQHALVKKDPVTLRLRGINDVTEHVTYKYEVTLQHVSGQVIAIAAIGSPTLKIIRQIPDYQLIQQLFVELPKDMAVNSDGDTDLLIGQDNNWLLPLELKREGNYTLYRSMIKGKSVHLVSGSNDSYVKKKALEVAAYTGFVVPLEFTSGESMGTDPPQKCSACQKCKECQYRTSLLSFKENAELDVIISGLSFDEISKKWTARYPFIVNPSILQDNVGQAISIMKAQEKRLKKQGRLDEFNEVFKDVVNRGVFKELTRTEQEGWEGPVNYISMVEAFKSGPHATTPLRICMNSSMKQPAPVSKSLNDLLMKGPSALANIYTVSLGFREFKYALTKDLSKFYNCVLADSVAQHTRRIVWRYGDENRQPTIYITTTVNFGDKPAGCIAIAAVRETAGMVKDEYPEASWFICNRTYVDDCTAGANTEDKLEQLSADLEEVVQRGGFKFKDTKKSGDSLIDGIPAKILGMQWDTEKDELAVDVKVNFTGKVRGAKLLPDVELLEEDVEEYIPEVVTKRIVWRIAQAQYDPLGLVSPYMMQFKLVMRDICNENGKVVGWDEPVSAEQKSAFMKALAGLRDLKCISFPRSIQPSRTAVRPPMLLVFGDGSSQAYAAVAYIRWELDDGSVECKVLTCKTRVAPKQKLTIPRLELLGSLAAVRLAASIKDSFTFEFGKVKFFTDSSAVLGMLQSETVTLLEFVSNRVAEIKAKSDVDKEWFWVPTDKNLADMATRPYVEPSDLAQGSEYQMGMDWMYLPEEQWPVRQKFGSDAAPTEERRKDLVSAVGQQEDIPFEVTILNRSNNYGKVMRILAYVLLACKRWRLYKGEPKSKLAKVQPSPPPAEYVKAATMFFIVKSQTGMKSEQAKGLYPVKAEFTNVWGKKDSILVGGGRLRNQLRVGYDLPGLPIIPGDCRLAELLLLRAHEVGHEGSHSTAMRSRNTAWITQVNKAAKKIVKKCCKCRRLRKEEMGQQMAPIPENRVGPAAIFSTIAVDMFGPLEYRDAVKKRTTGKGWGVIFVCTATSAIYLDLTESYSTDSFLQTLSRFMCTHGAPSRIISDRGEQLVAARKQLETWDFSKLTGSASPGGLVWDLVPTGGQHMNGQAERLIGLVKKVLVQLLENKRCTFGELLTVLKEAAMIVNSRPIGINRSLADPEVGTPLTPLHLMLGRATIEIPEAKDMPCSKLVERFHFVQSVKNEFWNKWKSCVFQGLDRVWKWRSNHRDVQLGDVVLLKEETAATCTYRLARVVELLPTASDGKTRKVVVEYKNPGEAIFRRSVRPVHKLVLILGHEELGEAEANSPEVEAVGQPIDRNEKLEIGRAHV